MIKFKLNNTFSNDLTSDIELKNYRRQVNNAFYSFVKPKITSNPELICFSEDLMADLGLTFEQVNSKEFLEIFSGNELIQDSNPYSMCYAGHQFGNWAGQLGDGRAINLAEIENKNIRFAIQLKGSGKTPYSRNADGLAVLRSSIREFLGSEAMFHLGIKTTRALSLIKTGDEVLRDILYDGNPKMEAGAIVCRVAKSFIRFGSFELFASRNDLKNLKKLADYTIKYFFEDLNDHDQKYVLFFEQVANQTMNLIIEWERVGFVHGVMNTDNMSILADTIDFGPFSFLDDYNLDFTPNTTDFKSRRYVFGNQANIALWNLTKLANALFPLIEKVTPLEEILNNAAKNYRINYVKMMCKKIGFQEEFPEDETIINDLEKQLQLTEIDYTLFFRNLSEFEMENPSSILFLKECFYSNENIEKTLESWKIWFANYFKRLQKETINCVQRKEKMNKFNPKFILRNYMLQLAIEQAEQGNYDLIKTFQQLIKKPYDEQNDLNEWFTKRPNWAKEKIGSSILSCSS